VRRATSKQRTDPDPVVAGQTFIAPGEIISIFGRNLGPGASLPATPGATPAVAIAIAGLASTLQYTVAGASGSTNVTVNFAPISM
jgi:uncharacterized protein (TIGR03437 family)